MDGGKDIVTKDLIAPFSDEGRRSLGGIVASALSDEHKGTQLLFLYDD